MTEDKKYRIQDLMEQIEKVDKMILFHADNPSKFMTEQYEDLKKRFLGELIDELMSISSLSKYSFKLVNLAINKYYPELKQATAIKKEDATNANTSLDEFKELEAFLAA